MNAVEHIVKRIRLYRKQKNMTIDDLSNKLHLSPSTISKYENGKIAMDIESLFYIAKVLDVSIDKLVDYREPLKKTINDKYGDNFFKRSNLFYLYRYFGMERKLGIGALEITPCEEEKYDNVMLYLYSASEEQYTKCSKLYNGRIYYDNNYASIVAAAMPDGIETVQLIFNCSTGDYVSGIVSGYSDIFKRPYSTKAIASINPLEHNKNLKELIKISAKSTVQLLKDTNQLIAE